MHDAMRLGLGALIMQCLLNASLAADVLVGEAVRWRIVNDDVMGGVSLGTMVQEPGYWRFQGQLSLENNGGFASTRAAIPSGSLRAGGALRLRVRGDGRCYQWRLKTHIADSGIAYRAEFCPPAQEWSTVDLPLSTFAPTWRGRILSGPPLQPESIGALGVLLADKRPGAFRLDIAAVEWLDSHELGIERP